MSRRLCETWDNAPRALQARPPTNWRSQSGLRSSGYLLVAVVSAVIFPNNPFA